MAQKVLVVTTDQPAAEELREILNDNQLQIVSPEKLSLARLVAEPVDWLLFDADQQVLDPLKTVRQIKGGNPLQKIIVFSVENDIAQAVAATKLGATDFLRRPFEVKLLKSIMAENYAAEELFFEVRTIPWLRGESQVVNAFQADLQPVFASTNNVLLLGERGINKIDLVEGIHTYGRKRHRRLTTLDLADFRRENLEPHFWGTIQEALALPELTSLMNEEDRCGTLYLENIESLDENFQHSIFEYFKTRKEKNDQEVVTIIGLYNTPGNYWGRQDQWLSIKIPALRERLEDLPGLIEFYLQQSALRYNKDIRGLSLELLNILLHYKYPGNNQELESIIQQGVILNSSALLNLKDILFSFNDLSAEISRKVKAEGWLSLDGAKNKFEKYFYQALLVKADNDLNLLSRLLDLPKTAISAKLEELS